MKIAFFLPSLAGGGAEKMVINIIEGLREYPCELELVVAKGVGEWLSILPADIRFIDLNVGRVILSIPALAKYLKKSQPDILFSGIDHANIAAIAAGKLSNIDVKNVISIQHLSTHIRGVQQNRRESIVDWLKPILYPRAARIICVSDGICDEMMDEYHLSERQLKRIYNPILSEKQIGREKQTGEATLKEKTILSAGRLTLVKDFPTLISAIKLVTKECNCQLKIFGEGPERELLQEKIDNLGLHDIVSLPGFALDLQNELQKADLFVLSSITEGFGNVIVEALAAGVPVVSTDCPSGPREILKDGKYGTLVQVGDDVAMAEAIISALEKAHDREKLIQRAKHFSIEKIAKKYFEFFSSVLHDEEGV